MSHPHPFADPASQTRILRIYPPKPTQVYLYGTCLVDGFYPESGLAAIELLTDQGIEVLYPQGQTCCGQPAYNAGYQTEAKTVALRQLPHFPLNIPIVVIAGSCAGMMRHHYPVLLAEQPQIAAFADRIFELTEFLLYVLQIKLTDRGAPERVALHTSCAARREMGSHHSSLALLQQLDNVEVVEQCYEAECCGFGGTFAVKHPDISAAMVADKTQSLVDTGVQRYVSADWGCMLNINGALEYQHQSLRGEHIASFLLARTSEPKG